MLLVAMAFPVAALAASGFDDSPSVGISDALVAPGGPMQQPVVRFQRTMAVAVKRIHVRHRAEAARQRREKFAQLPGGVSMATLESIAACESGGDPTVVSADGSYRGKYQFDYGTWESVGGHGDPAAAPEAEQDYRAALLYARSGSSPWPVCG
ncbi:MAG: transglycosylase family protein [Solirubrobacterales bacterium]